MTGRHIVEECPELDQWRPRRAEWAEWRETLGGRAKRKKKEEANEEEVNPLKVFFFYIYEFLSPTTTARAFIANTVQADEVVPVHLVPIDPFVVASSSVSVSHDVSISL